MMHRRSRRARSGATGSRSRFILSAAALAAGVAAPSAYAQIVNSTWNTGNGTWNIATNWAPNDVPDNGGGLTYNVFIGNAPAAAAAGVTFVPEDGTSDTIMSLTMSNAADLFLNGNQLVVTGQTTIDGAGSTIRVDPHTTPGTVAFNTANLDLNNGGGLTMTGGIATIDVLFEINTGALGGHGTINVGDNDAVVEKVFENSSLIQPSSNNVAPQTLFIHANGVDTIDLDGDSETGLVDVSNVLANVNGDTVTLVIDGPLSDAFSGTLQIGQRDTVTFNDNFTMSGANVDFDGGTNVATLNGPAHITSITTSAFTVAGAAVIENDMTFSGAANTVTVGANASLTLNGTVTIPQASALVLGSGAELIIGGATTITDAAGDFDWDGGPATTTVQGTGVLTLAVDQIDLGNDIYNTTLNLNDNGDLSVSVTGTEWQMAGTLNKNGVGSSNVTGDRLVVTSTGNIVVTAGTLDTPAITLQAGSDVTANGTLILGGGADLAGPATLSGTGTLRMEASSTVSANTTVNVNTFDWDGNAVGGVHNINDGVVFTINSPVFDADGDMDDPFSLAGNGAQLIVNGPAQWTATNTITANAAASGTATIGGTSRMILGTSAILNVDGNTNISAPITFGASSNTSIDAGMILRLSGGDNISNFNTISGGTISGAGTLAANAARVLSGNGTILSNIDFDGTSELRASGGMLLVNSTIADVGIIRVDPAPAVLSLVNALNTTVTDSGIAMNGGTLQGATITTFSNTKSILGSGTVTNAVINTGAIEASFDPLVFTNNSSDWDGAGNAGQLRASNDSTLELQDTGAAFVFGGSVVATGFSRVYAKGFGFNFAPGSTVSLTQSTYESDETTDFSGTVTIVAGGQSTLKVQVNRFLDFNSTSNTTLNSDLRLDSNNVIVDAGATFSGPGALIIDNDSHMAPAANANMNVLLDNRGALRIANSEGVGRVDVKDYQQRSAPPDPASHINDFGGELHVELTGTALNQYDRMVVSGTAIVDGYLNIDIDGAFVPALGNTFNIITGLSLVGTFDDVDVSGMPANRAFYVNYLANAVQLTVVNKPIFAADFDDDGDVDFTDLAIWKAAFNLNQLGDATGDNISDLRDWTIWRDQFGSKPGPPGSLVPEPGACGTLLALCGLGALRRRARRVLATVCVALFALLPTVASARPTMTVVNNGAGQFIVQVAPDPALFTGGQGSLAVELAFDVIGTDLSAVTRSLANFPFDLPGDNPFTGSTTNGVQANFSTDRVFMSLGSNVFASGALVNVATFSTGAAPTAVSWGGHLILNPATTPNYIGSRIAQNGVYYDGFQGVVNSPGALVGDFEPDGDVDAADIDLLLHAAQGSVPPALAKFDLSRNNIVNSTPTPNGVNSDADIWVRLLKHTEYGDTNLDRKVDVADLGTLATNWQAAGGWALGDFNGSGTVEVGDLGLLATNWQFGVAAPGPSFAEALASLGLPSVSVPEPTGLLIPALAATLRIARRRGK
jgi:hypothetical protein